MGVTKCIHLKCADVRGEQEEVLRGGGEHMPRIQIQEGHEEIETNG